MRKNIHEAIIIAICFVNSIIGTIFIGELIYDKNKFIGTLYIVFSLIVIIFAGWLLDESKNICRNKE